MPDQLEAGRPDDVRRWPGLAGRGPDSSRRPGLLTGAALLALVAAALGVAGVPTSGRQPSAATPTRPPQAGGVPLASPEPSVRGIPPMRVEPLCEIDTEFPDVSGEPPMDGPPGCPESTPAGWYASTAFFGNSSLLPFTFTLPDRWGVQADYYGSLVNLRTRGRAEVSVLSYPAAADPRLSGFTARGPRVVPDPSRLVRQLQQTSGLRVLGVEEPSLENDWWWTVDLTTSQTSPPRATAGCAQDPGCQRVLLAAFDDLDHPHVVGVRPGATSRLLLRDIVGDAAVWIWDVHDITDEVTREALQVAASIRMYPARLPKGFDPAG